MVNPLKWWQRLFPKPPDGSLAIELYDEGESETDCGIHEGSMASGASMYQRRHNDH